MNVARHRNGDRLTRDLRRFVCGKGYSGLEMINCRQVRVVAFELQLEMEESSSAMAAILHCWSDLVLLKKHIRSCQIIMVTVIFIASLGKHCAYVLHEFCSEQEFQ